MSSASGNTRLTWRELADAVWLAALRADGTNLPPPPDSTADDSHSPPTSAGVPDTAGPPEFQTPDAGGTTGLAEAYLRNRLMVDAKMWPGRAPADGTAPGLGQGPRSGTVAASASPLPDSMNIARALRPFKRPAPSPWEVEIDEDRTAERAAEDGLWLPYTRPIETRQHELTLVVDEGPSMPAWRRTVARFTSLLGQLGAFRDVRLRYLDLLATDGSDPEPPRVILRGPHPGSAVGDPAELLGSPGQRIVLVLTDGLGIAWRTGAAQRVLATWGQNAPVAVIHLLPQQAWHHTSVCPNRVRLRAPEASAPNRRYMIEPPATRAGVLDALPEDWTAALPIPVLELDKHWLTWWARLVTGHVTDWQDSWVLLAGASAPEAAEPQGLAPTGREQVHKFRANASPTAVRLAMHLAAMPLEPGLIELLQRTLLPESRPLDLAEILASGLIYPVKDSSGDVRYARAHQVRLEFIDGAREALLAGAVRADTARAFAAAGDYYGDRTTATRAMRTALISPDEAPDPPVNPETLRFVRVELAVMRALSGPYLSRARRLGAKVAELNQIITPRLESDGTDIQMHDDGIADPGLTNTATADPNLESTDFAPVSSGGLGGTSLAMAALQSGPRDFQAFTPPVWNVPPKNPNFTGREDLLAELHERLRGTSTAAVTPNTLHGMGGVGKSQIAIEYVYRHIDDYDIIWWIPAEQQSQILASLAELAQSLKLDVGTEANTAVPAVREALRSGKPYKNWLLVFDNAEDIATVRGYFPTGGSGKVLVTSRNLEWSSVADTLSVDVFRRDESKALLQRRNADLSDTEADHLAEALGDLPLAIEQAASWRAATGMAVDEYLSLIEQKRLELLDESTSPDYSLSVAAAWNVSLDRLEENNKAALQLLQVCAFMAPEPIPRSLFRGARNVQLTPELDELLTDPIKLGRAIRDLSKYALARIDHRNNTLQLHRLVQAALIGRIPPELQQERRHNAHVLLANANPNSPGASDQWPHYQALLPHVNVSGAIECDDPWVRQLLAGMIRFLYFWGDHESCLALAKDVTDRWRARFGDEDTETLSLRKFYAFIARVMGGYGVAAEVDAEVVSIYERIANEDDEGTLDAILQVSSDMRANGDYTAARDNDQLVLSRAQRAFGDDDPATLAAAHNLGVSLRLVGDFKTALKLDQDTWQRRAIILGEDDAATLSTLNGIALDQREAGDYIGARDLQEETYARTVHIFRVSNPITIAAARNLAVCRRRAGDAFGARTLSEETLARFQRRYGDAYPATLATATNFAVDLRQTEDLRASRDLDQRTAGQYAQVLGDQHPYTLLVRSNLAITLRLLGEVDSAYRLNVVTLSNLRERLGDAHPITLACAANLGSDYFALQNFEEALRQDAGTLEKLREVFGDDHPTTLACALNVAMDYRAAGRGTEGDALRAETTTRLRRVLGASHPAAVAAAKGSRADIDTAPMPM
jgi:hypothetical protein